MAVQSSGFGGKLAGKITGKSAGFVGHHLGSWLGEGGKMPKWMPHKLLGGKLAGSENRFWRGLGKTLTPVASIKGGIKNKALARQKEGKGKFLGAVSAGLSAMSWERIAPALTPYFWKGWQRFREQEQRKSERKAEGAGYGTAEDIGSPTRLKDTLKRGVMEAGDLAEREEKEQELKDMDALLKNNPLGFVEETEKQRLEQVDSMKQQAMEALDKQHLAKHSALVAEKEKATTDTQIADVQTKIDAEEEDYNKEKELIENKYKQKREDLEDQFKGADYQDRLKEAKDFLTFKKDALEKQSKMIDENGEGELFFDKEISTRNAKLESLVEDQEATLRSLESLQKRGLSKDSKAYKDNQAHLAQIHDRLAKTYQGGRYKVDESAINLSDPNQLQNELTTKRTEFDKMAKTSMDAARYKRDIGSENMYKFKKDDLQARLELLLDDVKADPRVASVLTSTNFDNKIKDDQMDRLKEAVEADAGLSKAEKTAIIKNAEGLRHEYDNLVGARDANTEFKAKNYGQMYQFNDLDFTNENWKKTADLDKEKQSAIADRQAEKASQERYLHKVIEPAANQDWGEAQVTELKQKKDDTQKDVAKIRSRMVSYRRRGDYARRAALEESINEEYGKIKHINSSEELQGYYNSALSKGDTYLALASLRRLTETANLNDILNDHDYTANWDGLNKLVQTDLIDKLGMGEQLALGIQNDLSYIAEDINHWTYARTVTADSGRLRQNSELEQSAAVAGELLKRSGRDLAGRLNRLGYGGENPRTGKWEPNLYAYTIFEAFAPDYAYAMRRGEMNKNAQMRILQEKHLFEGINSIWDVPHPEYPREPRSWGQILEAFGAKYEPRERTGYFRDNIRGKGFAR